MGINRLFWSQELLDRWIVDEKIVLKDDLLTINSEKRSYRVSQAVYFATDVGDGKDPHRLVGRAKEISKLDSIGAERYMDSVLVGDSAYQVVSGFIGEPLAVVDSDKTDKNIERTSASTKEKGADEAADDQDLLAKFLLENL